MSSEMYLGMAVVFFWLAMAGIVVKHALDRGSRLWPLHGFMSLSLGLGYIIPYYAWQRWAVSS